MKLFVNNRSGVPIYKQLEQQIEKGVAGNILKPGEQLPTVREVALKLTINPNTVARAYRELEARGILVSIQGSGTYISQDINLSMFETKEVAVKRLLTELYREAWQLGISPDMLKRQFSHMISEWEKGGLNGE